MARRSKGEQKLIDFSRESFGDRLSELLLCGYGEERVLSSRDFAVKLAGHDEAEMQLRLMFVAEAPAGANTSLPHLKEPLVLLALLRLLLGKGRGSNGRLSYSCDDVLGLLGWPGTPESWTTVASSVTKYFHAFYQLNGRGGIRSENARKLRPLARYDFAVREKAESESRMTAAVTFGLDFIEPLRRGKLLGMDWGRVESLTPLPAEFFNLL
jgi:hypothetical protein